MPHQTIGATADQFVIRVETRFHAPLAAQMSCRSPAKPDPPVMPLQAPEVIATTQWSIPTWPVCGRRPLRTRTLASECPIARGCPFERPSLAVRGTARRKETTTPPRRQQAAQCARLNSCARISLAPTIGERSTPLSFSLAAVAAIPLRMPAPCFSPNSLFSLPLRCRCGGGKPPSGVWTF
jgi:hypothetical protein